MSFWLTAAAMVAIALAFVLPPLLRRPRGAGPAREAINVDIYRQRLVELDAERADSALTDASYAQARSELEHALLQDVADSVEAHAPGANSPRALIAVVVLLVPLLAGGLYWRLGSLDQVLNPALPQAASDMHSVGQMIGRLEARLLANPNDAVGWSMLGRSYVALGRYGDAVTTFAKARELAGDDPDLLADHAEALALANNNALAGEPERLAARALKADPKHMKALWLAGHAAVQQGRSAEGVAYWQRLLAQQPPQSAGAEKVQQLIAQVQGQAGARPAPPAQAVQAAGKTSISVRVALKPELKAGVTPTDTVFVFARAAEGPTMPLAVVRKQVKDLPVTVTLDDSMAMMPQLRLSNFAEVVVGARISKSGDVIPKSGDLQGLSGKLAVGGGKPVAITIAEKLP